MRKVATPPARTRGSPGPRSAASKGRPGPRQEVQDIRVVSLKGDGEGHRGKIRQGPLGLEGEDGGAGAAVLVCLLGGGQKGPFADESRVGVEQVVDGLKAQVAHGHRVDLGIDQGDGKAGAPLPHHRALFLGEKVF